MKRIVTCISFVLVALAAASPAAAQAPTREVLPLFEDEVSTRCGFDVLIDYEQAQPPFDLVFTDENGNEARRISIGPGVRATYTNPVTGETLSFNISGPGVYVTNPDGSQTLTGRGGWELVREPGTLRRGLFITYGRVIITWNAAGELASIDLVAGRIVDICAELAT